MMKYYLPAGVLLLAAAAAATADEPRPTDKSALGRLVIEGKAVHRLSLETADFRLIELTPTEGGAALPAGRYEVVGVTLQGGRLVHRGLPGRDEDWFELRPGETHHLKVGAPLRPEVHVSRLGNRLTMGYGLIDAAGREYVGRHDAQPPTVTILRDGEPIASGRFEYG